MVVAPIRLCNERDMGKKSPNLYLRVACSARCCYCFGSTLRTVGLPSLIGRYQRLRGASRRGCGDGWPCRILGRAGFICCASRNLLPRSAMASLGSGVVTVWHRRSAGWDGGGHLDAGFGALGIKTWGEDRDGKSGASAHDGGQRRSGSVRDRGAASETLGALIGFWTVSRGWSGGTGEGPGRTLKRFQEGELET